MDPKRKTKVLAAKRKTRATTPLEAVQKKLKADVLIYNGPITDDGYVALWKVVCALRTRQPNVLLCLTTLGGDPDAAFRMVRGLKCHYKNLHILIAGVCKSAGTLMCIGADDLIICDSGELGPLDIQMRKENELLESESGLDATSALGVLTAEALNMFRMIFVDFNIGTQLSTKLATTVASQMTSSLLGHIYSQIDPIRLGKTYRSNRVALEYGTRLKPNARGSIAQLVNTYPSHSFVILRDEAMNLFSHARAPDDIERRFVEELDAVYGLLREEALPNGQPRFIYVVPEEGGKKHEAPTVDAITTDAHEPKGRRKRNGVLRRVRNGAEAKPDARTN